MALLPYGEGNWGQGAFGEGGAYVEEAVTGVSASALVNDVAGAGQSNGWGMSTWDNDGGWGGIISAYVFPTGFELTASLGEEEAFTTVDVQVTGVSTNVELGSVEVVPADTPSGWGANYWGGPYGWGGLVIADVNVTGVEATTTLGVVSEVIGKVNVVLTGVQGNTALGEAEVDGKANVSPSGVSALSSVGNVTVFGKANIEVTGVAGTVVLGEVRQATSNTVQVTGLAGTIFQGSVAINGEATVILTGVSATGRVSRPLVWGLIDTSQNPNWVPIAAQE